MYKTTRSPQLPEYADHSPRDEDSMEGVQLKNSVSHPQYRVFSMEHQNQATRSRSETSFSDNISLTAPRSATQDLAEFLKTSNPEDFKRFPGSSSSEDLASSVISQKRSFRFLKSPTSKSPPSRPSSIAPPLPNKNVVSKITSRGRPYLQINVDYDDSLQESHTTITAGQQTSFSSETSSVMYQRVSIAPSTTSSDSARSTQDSYSGERQNINPLPRNAHESRVTLDAATMGRYQQFLDSELSSKNPIDITGTMLESPTDIVSAGMAELRAFQRLQRLERMKTPPHSPEFASIPRSPIEFSPRSPRSRHSRPNSARLVSARSSVTSDFFEDITDIELEGPAGPQGQRKKSRKAPPRPGPPPNRSLPSLPEGHDDQRLGSTIKSRDTLNVRHSQISLTSSNASTSSYLDDAQSIKSDRKSREERVKARKAKDLNKHLLLMKEKKDKGKIVDNCGSTASETFESSSENFDRSTCPPSSVGSDSGGISQSSPRIGSRHLASIDKNRRNSSVSIVLSEHPASAINSLPRNSSENSRNPALYISDSTASPGNENPQSPASPTLTAQSPCCSAREMELEARMLAVERKNKMLEQALMAVIRSAVKGQAQRRAELLKANALEELLDEMDLDEFPSAFAAGGQMD